MANFLNKMGNQGIAEVAGKKAGEVVENTVKSVLGKGEAKKEEGKSGTFDAGDVLSLASGGSKEGEGGGLDVKNVVGGLFK